MGRYLFRSLTLLSFMILLKNDPVIAVAGVADVVSDPGSYVYYVDMVKSAADTAETAGKQLEQAKKIASTASEALNTANAAVTKLQTMNSVIGSPLKDSVLRRFSSLKSLSQSYGGFLGAMGSDNSDRLQAANGFANREFGTEDHSRLLEGKRYFQRQFYPEDSSKIDLGKARFIKISRENAAKDSVLTSLAVSKQHKQDLSKDHQELVLISQSGRESVTLNHQTLTQTKLLERIAQSLEKLILLQSQQLEFMAKTYIGDRGVGLGDLQKDAN